MNTSFFTVFAAWSTALAVQSQTMLFDTNRFVAAGELDPTFIPEPIKSRTGGAFGEFSPQLQPDGKVLLQGINQSGPQSEFAGYDLMRLNADGTPDLGFRHNIGFEELPSDSDFFEPPAVQPNGRILVLGSFRAVEGQPREHFAGLNSDGSLDRAFNPKLASRPYRLLVQPDGKILVGRFESADHKVFLLERLNVDGSTDASFTARLEGPSVFGFDAPRLTVQPDGRVLVRGRFERVNGIPRARFVRLLSNGSLDESFNISEDFRQLFWVDGRVAVARDGRLLVGAYRPGVEPQYSAPTIAFLNSEGKLLKYTVPGMSSGALLELSNGRWLVGWQNLGQGNFVLLNPDGTLDEEFQPAIYFHHVIPSKDEGTVLVIGWDDKSSMKRLFRMFLEPQHFSFRQITRLSPTDVKLTVNWRPEWSPLVEASTDSVNWSMVPVLSWEQGASVWNFLDSKAPNDGHRIYRARRP